ncbi:hypothetical protein A8C56_03855 [Niabella ginsenosidivorans]|uniref:Uncharacterized protein n=1 Tax=Niabella ginsenosidivorans TaxID=1176587 RepID=A0A1A9I0H9_9BACT|nr:hypothetical protein A8C56_03855 [Niabella ginsenosidivorans]
MVAIESWFAVRQAVNDKCCKLLEMNLHKERHSDRMEQSGMSGGISLRIQRSLGCAANDAFVSN